MNDNINFSLPIITGFESAYEICKTFLVSSPEQEAYNIKTFLKKGLKDEVNIKALLVKEYELRKEKAGDKEYIKEIMQERAYTIINFNATKFQLYQKIETINHLQLVDKDIDFLSAFEIFSEGLNKNEKTKLHISISINKGFREFIKYLNEDIEAIITEEEDIELVEFEKTNSKEFTTARQVLVMHYIFEELKVPHNRTLSAKARFCKMLTDKNVDRIKKILENPLEQKSLEGQDEDLRFVRKYFFDLGLDNIVNAINSDLTSLSSN